MEFAELTPPDRAVIKAHGQAPGSAVDATRRWRLSDGPDGTTVMDWSADVNLSGTLASVGARLIDGTANKMIGQTFDCMREKLEAGRSLGPGAAGRSEIRDDRLAALRCPLAGSIVATCAECVTVRARI